MGGFLELITVCFLVFFPKQGNGQTSSADNFNTYYTYQWGAADHFIVNPQGTDVQLKLDQSLGGAGFQSKSSYGSGGFRIKIKTPKANSPGINTNFYLIDHREGAHCEVDFELLSQSGRKSILHTNIFANDNGQREEGFQLWFDPSKAFHTYGLLWNNKQLVFFVDKIPIRVFKNHRGLPYITTPMHIEASIWNAEWAGNISWAEGPFMAHYEGFRFPACTVEQGNCFSKKYFWNSRKYSDLNAGQKAQMREYRKKYMIYDYCKSAPKPECKFNEI